MLSQKTFDIVSFYLLFSASNSFPFLAGADVSRTEKEAIEVAEDGEAL